MYLRQMDARILTEVLSKILGGNSEDE